MMELFRQWLFGIVATALILSVIYTLVPLGGCRTVVRFTGGFVLLLAVMGPLGKLDMDWMAGYRDSEEQIQKQMEAYREMQVNKTEEIIVDQVAAYISGIGNELGIACHPVVTTRVEHGIPLPDTVVMDIPLHRALAERIADELGITRERQIWQER